MNANLFRITLSVMLAVLMLAQFFGVARADFGIACQPDGRPAVQIEGFTPFPNREVAIIAFDQNGKETVTKGKLDFGPWQQVYYAEFDGRRAKRVILKVMGE